jgi:hypothetical protein
MRKGIIAAPSVVVLTAGLMWAVPAQADDVATQQASQVTNTTMIWPINACAFQLDERACTSLTERQTLEGNVTRGEVGWVFTGGDGAVTSAGEMTVSWNASVQLGNTNRGNYTITFADPVLTVSAAGEGAITATVTSQIGTQTPVTNENVTVVEFAAASTNADFDSTPSEFAEPLLEALSTASGAGFNLSSWFQPTGSPTLDPLKVPGAVTFDRWVPTLTVTMPPRYEKKNPRVKDRRFMVTVRGTGFDPAIKADPSVNGIYLVFGTNPATTPDGYAFESMNSYFRSRYLWEAPDAAGEFTSPIQVRGTYVKGSQRFNGRFGEPLGVGTWAAHRHATTEWDAFTQIRFRK